MSGHACFSFYCRISWQLRDSCGVVNKEEKWRHVQKSILNLKTEVWLSKDLSGGVKGLSEGRKNWGEPDAQGKGLRQGRNKARPGWWEEREQSSLTRDQGTQQWNARCWELELWGLLLAFELLAGIPRHEPGPCQVIKTVPLVFERWASQFKCTQSWRRVSFQTSTTEVGRDLLFSTFSSAWLMLGIFFSFWSKCKPVILHNSLCVCIPII